MVALLVLFTVLLFLTADFIVHEIAIRRAASRNVDAKGTTNLALEIPYGSGVERLDALPADAFVGPGHVWLRQENGEPNETPGSVRVGVDRILLSFLDGLEALYPQPVGSTVKRGGPLFMLRKGNRALKVRSPIEGVISAVNERAQVHPADLQQDPFDDGWICEMTTDESPASWKQLLSGQRAMRWMRKEAARFRDLVMDVRTPPVPGFVTLPDGGMPTQNMAHHVEEFVGDQEWEDLVASFFNGARQVERRPESSKASSSTDRS